MTVRAVFVAACLGCLVSPPTRVGLLEPQREALPEDVLLASYRQCLDLLRRGLPDEAVAKLREIDRSRLTAAVGAFRTRIRISPVTLDSGDVKAAVLLHVDVARREHVPPLERRIHLAAGWSIASAARSLIPSAFVRDCHLLVAWSLQHQLDVDELVRQLSLALDAFPDDAELLLAQGSLWELLARLADRDVVAPLGSAVRGIAIATPTGQSDPGYAELDVSTPGIYGKCARLYSRALRTPAVPSPAREEIRLRLSHVLAMVGKFDEAREAVAPLEDHDQSLPVEIRYLAALFRGRALLGLGKAGAAATEYRRAASLIPGCQTPQVALGSALRAAGELAAASEVARAMLAAGPGSICPADPWVLYPEGQAWRRDALAARLYGEVRR